MDFQEAQDTIPEWTRFSVSINASPKIFCCFTLKHANDVFFFWILKLFTLFCSAWTWFIRWIFPVFTVNNIDAWGNGSFLLCLLCFKILRLPVILLHHLPEYPLNILLEYLRSLLFFCPLWKQATDVLVMVLSIWWLSSAWTVSLLMCPTMLDLKQLFSALTV